MYHRLFSLFGAVVIALWGQTAAAGNVSPSGSVSLIPSSSNVAPGTTFTVDLFLDADGVPGNHPGDFSGQVRIMYDPNLLTLVEPPSGTLTPLMGGTGGDRSFGFGNITFDDDPDQGVVGTLTFQTTGAFGPTDIAAIGVEDGFELLSFANNAGGDLNEFFPNISGTSVQAVPLPAAAWLMLSALGALGMFGRKSRATSRIA